MAKKRAKIDSRQMSLFEYLEQVQAQKRSSRSQEGTADISNRLRVSLNSAIRQSILSRHQVAGEMSHLLGVEISKTMIDSWTAESKPQNRIPAEYMPAFCRVTSCTEPLEIMNEAAGIFGMPGPDALRAEIQRFDEQEKQARAAKRKRLLFLSEIEKRSSQRKRRHKDPSCETDTCPIQ